MERLVKVKDKITPLGLIHEMYSKECTELGLFVLSKNKFAQVIHQMFDPVVLKARNIDRKHTNCFIELFMRNKMECKIANPVTSVPLHYIVQNPEHEIRGHSLPTM